MKTRSVVACLNWVAKTDPYVGYFFFRSEGNYHCSPCPKTYRGGTSGTASQRSRIYIYQIIGWSMPDQTYGGKVRIVAYNRYCTGYKKSAFNHRSVLNCMKWVQSVAAHVRFFFFREEGNYHCSPCPWTYKGGNSGTGYQNSLIFTYQIVNFSFDETYGGKVKIVSRNRYCTGYKKSNMGLRSVVACMSWVRSVAPWVRYFFFRSEGNYHCSPCPWWYKGHPTSGTSRQNSRIFIYRIVGWKFDESYGGKVKVVSRNRYCTGYKKSNMKLRSVVACLNWVAKADPYVGFFFFRSEGNYHCSPCPW
jgi:hypothetical protein